MNLVDSTNVALRTKCEPLSPEEIPQFARSFELLTQLTKQLKAIGIAANQVGITRAFFVTTYDAFPLAINPRYSSEGLERVSKPEQSLSRADWSGFITRPLTIHAEWVNAQGEDCQTALTAMEARVFMHLADYLMGIPPWMKFNRRFC